MNSKDERIQQQISQSEGGTLNNATNMNMNSDCSPTSIRPTPPTTATTPTIASKSTNNNMMLFVKEKDFNSEALIRQQLSQPAPNSTKKTKQDFDFIRTIGKGSYGKVKLVIEKETGKGYAAKILNKQLILKEKKAKYVNTEKTILDSLDHPNIVKLFYTFQDETNLYFILEYCPNGDLLEQLKKCSCFGLDVVRFYSAEILRDFEYPPNFDADAQDLVDRLLNLNAEQRPSFQEIRSHQFFRDIDFNNLAKCDPPVIVPIDPVSPTTTTVANLSINNNNNNNNISNNNNNISSNQLHRIRSQSEAIPNNPLFSDNHVILRERSSSQTTTTTSSTTSSSTSNSNINSNTITESNINSPLHQNINSNSNNNNKNNCRIFISPTELLLGGKEVKKELREEQKDIVWNRFLLPNNEIILAIATLEKKTGLITKKRVMIITDTPRIFYVDPHKMIVKGEIPVDSTLSAESKSMRHFRGRHKHFFDLYNNCKRWVDYINDLKMLGVVNK
ncbi:protein serine/threonine kinase [Heterostelium album PN500]|uniref:non-specific serine/threonine protein kinase n=1 Tax=Heterostelium pallidum (strain ATCC 26659 / Pp 5 / PN500) TaxID=670386 RepID=D3BJW1_HETP5|nr:protein serine/threonine kinase [Heterostelium album PN500]EFA78191.1 protein serine/threonine kinase [Heterostelium album PN500]|eukprot:XP_020430317.1 protein serine/threonine kinase [Heterostelium album PN500]